MLFTLLPFVFDSYFRNRVLSNTSMWLKNRPNNVYIEKIKNMFGLLIFNVSCFQHKCRCTISNKYVVFLATILLLSVSRIHTLYKAVVSLIHTFICWTSAVPLLPPAIEVWGKVIFSQAFFNIFMGWVGGVWLPSVYHGSHDWGSASRGVCLRGVLHPGGVCTQRIWGLGRSPLKIHGIQSTSRQYASYWNAFLFQIDLWMCSTTGRNDFVPGTN